VELQRTFDGDGAGRHEQPASLGRRGHRVAHRRHHRKLRLGRRDRRFVRSGDDRPAELRLEHVQLWGSGSGERGVQFQVSTAGFFDIGISFDLRHSNTSSRFVQFQYSLDGTNFSSKNLVDDGIFEASLGGDTWYNLRTVSLAGVAGASNNANFAFRIVAIFAPGTSEYVASTATSTWAGTGTLRYDMVTVMGVVPAPGVVATLALAGLVGSRRRR
jgi:hypothetical protein